MEFIAEEKFVYTGDNVDLFCTIQMSQPRFPSVKISPDRSLDTSSHDIEEITVNKHTVKTDVWLYSQEDTKVDYICEVESYLGDQFVEKVEKVLTIYSYSKQFHDVTN